MVAEQETVFVLVMGMVGAMGGAARVVADWRVRGFVSALASVILVGLILPSITSCR